MNRFFRSALFPLIIIVVLAYLAMQTLTGNDKKAEKQTLSQLKTRDRGATRARSTRSCSTRASRSSRPTLRGRDDEKIVVHYPAPESAVVLERAARGERTSATTRRAPAARRGGRC